MRHRGILVGTFFGLVLGIVVGVAVVRFAEPEILPLPLEILFVLCGFGLAAAITGLGAMVGSYLAGSPQAGKRSPAPQPRTIYDGAVILAELVEEHDAPVAASLANRIGSRVGKWGWVFGSVGILTAILSTMQPPSSARGASLLVAIASFYAGVSFSIASLASALSRKPRGATNHAVAGLLASSACFLAIAVCGCMALVESARLADAARKRDHWPRNLARQGPQSLTRPPGTQPAPPRRRHTLQDAVRFNLLKEVERYMDEGAEINTVYEDGQTLLSYAVMRGHTEVAGLLLEHGADVNGNPDSPWSPLIVAISEKRIEMAKLILRYNPDLSAADARHNPLFYAIRDAPQLVENLLAQGSDPNFVSSGGETALQSAVHGREPALVRLLLEKGADPNSAVPFEKGALAAAIRNRDIEMVRLLASHGAKATFSGPNSELFQSFVAAGPECLQALIDVSATSLATDKQAAVYAAIYTKNATLVRRLLGEDIDLSDSHTGEWPVLAAAIRARDPEILRLLASHNAKFVCADQQKKLHDVIRIADPEWLEALVDVSADAFLPNGRQELLLAAIRVRKANLVQSLIDVGVDLDAPLADGRLALTEAVFLGDPAVVKILLEATEKIPEAALLAALDRRSGEMIRMLASHGATAHFSGEGRVLSNAIRSAVRGGDPECLKALVDVSADAFLPDGRQQVLYQAIVAEKADLVRSLIDAGVDLHVDLAGKVPALTAAIRKRKMAVVEVLLAHTETIPAGSLLAAVETRSLENVKLLLDRGADLNIQDYAGRAPLHAAANGGNGAVANYLLDNGADPGMADKNGTTALHLAAASKNLQLIQRLVEAGADVNVRNSPGETPLGFAMVHRHIPTIKLLVQLGADPNVKPAHGPSPLERARVRGMDMSIFDAKSDQ